MNTVYSGCSRSPAMTCDPITRCTHATSVLYVHCRRSTCKLRLCGTRITCIPPVLHVCHTCRVCGTCMPRVCCLVCATCVVCASHIPHVCCTRAIHVACVVRAWYTRVTYTPHACCLVCATLWCVLRICHVCCTRAIHMACVAHAWYTCVTYTPHACCLVCATCMVSASYMPRVWCVHTIRQCCSTQNMDNLLDIMRRIRTHNVVVFPVFKNSKAPATKPTRNARALQQR